MLTTHELAERLRQLAAELESDPCMRTHDTPDKADDAVLRIMAIGQSRIQATSVEQDLRLRDRACEIMGQAVSDARRPILDRLRSLVETLGHNGLSDTCTACAVDRIVHEFNG